MYFQTNVRKVQKSNMGVVVAVVLIVAVIGGALFYFRIQRGEEIKLLTATANNAVSSDTVKKMEAALNDLNGSKLTNEVKALDDLRVLLSWMLWVDYGIQPAGGIPAPSSLASITADSPLPLLLARARADIHVGDPWGGEALLKKARSQHNREPQVANMMARMSMEQGKVDPKALDVANARFFKAMDLLQSSPEGAMPISKAQIMYGYARTMEMTGNLTGAINNYSATTTTDSSYIWATIRNEMAKIPPEMSFEEADEAIKKMIDDNNAMLSPRQRSAMHMERAHWALETFNLDLAIDRLNEAVQMDRDDVEPLLKLAQIYLEMGKLNMADKSLDAARKIAPKDVRILCRKIALELAKGKTGDARGLLKQLPKSATETVPGFVSTARVHRAAGELEMARAALDAAKEKYKDKEIFPLSVENAILLTAEGKEEAKEAFEKLLPEARKGGHLALAPILQARLALLETGSDRATAIEQAEGAAEANENANALVILAEALIADGKKDEAKLALEAARKVGDLPKIETLLKEVG